jgi:FkbM family methyltransferase
MEIGAADGLDTLDFVETFSDTKFQIYCFEPDNRNIIEFKKRLPFENVHLFEGAIGSIDGLVDWYTSTKNKITQEELIYSSSLRAPSGDLYDVWPQFKDTFVKGKVKSIKLDTFVKQNNINSIDFVWMDVQGAEDIIIGGGRKAFDGKIKYLYTEYSNREIYQGEKNLDAILKLLPSYKVLNIIPNVNGDLSGGDALLLNGNVA